MTGALDVDIWIRGTHHATTHHITSVPLAAATWTDEDVRQLLSEMLRALDRENNPGGDAPAISLRGFSWIVSADDNGGVLVHLDMQTGTASAGPFAIDEQRLTAMIARVMEKPQRSERVH
jgi:hypothetical protein